MTFFTILGVRNMFLLIVLNILFLVAIFYRLSYMSCNTADLADVAHDSVDDINFYDNNIEEVDTKDPRDIPIIFIGGFPRSGTTLMRAMLDAHPDIRCGKESRIIARLLGFHQKMKKSEKESRRLFEAGVSDQVFDSAVAAFILTIVTKQVFSKAKFVFMIRDGRASVASAIRRNVTIRSFDLKDPGQCLEQWSNTANVMYEQCQTLGSKNCFPMYYEQLVQHPKEQTQALFKFLDIPWNKAVLHHQDFINHGISLSNSGRSLATTFLDAIEASCVVKCLVFSDEKSSDQVIKPIYLNALSNWVGFYDSEIVKNMEAIAPMLQKFGYNALENPPDYSQSDSFVIKWKHENK